MDWKQNGIMSVSSNREVTVNTQISVDVATYHNENVETVKREKKMNKTSCTFHVGGKEPAKFWMLIFRYNALKWAVKEDFKLLQ